MEYRRLGNSDLKVSVVGLGTWQFSESWGVTSYEAAKNIIEEAYHQGINFIDTAAVYGRGLSEEFIGRALKELGIRDEMIIATKLPGDFLSKDDVFRGTDRCLKRLGVDVIDVMQVHWPPLWHNFSTCEYMKALERLVSLGKIRYIGVSNFPVELLDSALYCLSNADIVSNQVRYNLIERMAEDEILPYCEAANISLIAWSPLARGALTGKYSPKNLPLFNDVRSHDPIFTKENFDKIYPLISKLTEIGKKYDKTPAQVAINWLLMVSEYVITIPGAKNAEQVKMNAGSTDWRLSYDDWRVLDEISKSIKYSRVIW